jgi:thiosulfate/3-mercaptopyruvate sulfurtransferase
VVQEAHAPIVSCETLFEHMHERDWVVFDCRHHLTDPEWGPRQYQKGHIPGSFHAHIDRHLAGPVGDGRRGRHPMPLPGVFQRFLSTYGVTADTQIVAYDDNHGAWAARLWWLARHHGHAAVAVLDGGMQRWKQLGLPLSTQHERPRAAGAFTGQPGAMPTVDTEALLADGNGRLLLDARAPERYRGEVEPVDAVAGHIPGAINAPYAEQVGPDGRFLSPDELRARFEALGVGAGEVVCYCGSGVTSCQVVLAVELAGLGTPALYPGSWSQWCHDRMRPIGKAP